MLSRTQKYRKSSSESATLFPIFKTKFLKAHTHEIP